MSNNLKIIIPENRIAPLTMIDTYVMLHKSNLVRVDGNVGCNNPMQRTAV